jgi:5-methylcytosine-specific restriction endonuclease McrA
MSRPSIVQYLNPWKLRRERQAEMVKALRSRDGDGCARCRRPLRFDLPDGHDQGPRAEPIAGFTGDTAEALDNLRLCHRRCHSAGLDHTGEVTERMRRKAEAALFTRDRAA